MMPGTLSLRRVALTFLVFGVLVAGFAAEVVAQSRSFQTGPVVRRQLLFRSDRVELAPMLGSSIAPLYQRTLFLTVTGRYHLTNSFALGVNANVGALNLNTKVARDYEDLRDAIPGARRPDLLWATPLLMTDVHISYVPLHGKANLFGSNILHWDFYVNLGVGGVLVNSDSDDLSGFRFGPAIGVGLRTFVNDRIAVNLLFQDYLYSSAEAQQVCCGPRPVPAPVEERFQSHFLGSLGVSVFFPSEVRVSR
jgi:outer membrane beta-barrel protein